MKKKDEKEEKKSISEVTQEGKEELLSPPKKRRGRPKKEEIPESSGVEAEVAEPVLKEEKKILYLQPIKRRSLPMLRKNG